MKMTIFSFENVLSEIDYDCILRLIHKYTPQWRIHNR